MAWDTSDSYRLEEIAEQVAPIAVNLRRIADVLELRLLMRMKGPSSEPALLDKMGKWLSRTEEYWK